MTIMDKEDQALINDKKVMKKKIKNTNNKKKLEKEKTKKEKPKKKHTLFYKVLSFLLIIMTVFTIGIVIYNETFTIFYMIPIIIISIIALFIITYLLNKNRLRCWIKNIFSLLAILIIIFEILMLLYGTKTLKFLENITDTGYRVETFGVYVLNDSSYAKLNDLNGKKIYYLNHEDDKNIRDALAKIEKKITVSNDYLETTEELLNALSNKETDAILMETTYEDIIREEMSEMYDQIKLIETIDIVDIVEVLKSDADITKDPFAIYISGIDTSGNVGSKARSDVNLVMAINPKTKNILMVNTPRDYYVTLHTKGKKDKLTHAGVFGVEESLATLADLYEVDIDYYARVNFTSFVKIVDALDGIKVDVPKRFCEQNSKRSFANGDLICLNKGLQTLRGEQALAFARHRKTLAAGDRTRGENQMKVLEAIINKAMSPKILTKYNSLITALEGRVTTNMTTDEIFKFAKKQVGADTTWKFTSLSANGKDARGICFSTGSGRAYVMEPDMETVEKIKKAFNNLFNGESDLLIGTEENTTSTTKVIN